jgi:membrane dipeptidase
VRALTDHSRNMDDAQLQALKANGGVIQVVAFSNYVTTRTGAATPAAGAGGRGAARGANAGEARGPAACPVEPDDAPPKPVRPERATVKDFVDHIEYAVKQVGIDHVGISSDFDGGGGVEGWDSAAETFNVTLELVRRGYRQGDIAKLWGGNLLRVWRDVERVAARLRKEAR